jgi:hypothetical protein
MGINTPKNNRIQQTAGDHTWVQTPLCSGIRV